MEIVKYKYCDKLYDKDAAKDTKKMGRKGDLMVSLSPPKPRIDSIATCNRVKLELLKAPPGKLFSVNALAEKTDMDPHTVKRCIQEDLGEELDGKLSKATTDGQEIFYLEPVACDMLFKAGQRAREEGKAMLAKELEAVQREYCYPSRESGIHEGAVHGRDKKIHLAIVGTVM